jgi:hypothetical protein
MRSNSGQGLEPYGLGGGSVRIRGVGGARLEIPPVTNGYANAQLDDYRPFPRRRFPCRPGARLSLRARCSHDAPLGTLGFGFWNDPFSLSIGGGGAARRLPAAPRAIWFFYGSPPNDFTFTSGGAGHGLRAMALRSPWIPSLPFFVMAVTGWALTRLPILRGPLMRIALSRIRSAELALPDATLSAWHEYEIGWNEDGAQFAIDSAPIMHTRLPILEPLGFVTWIDNQYAIATPKDGLRFGTIATLERQWLEIEELRLQRV